MHYEIYLSHKVVNISHKEVFIKIYLNYLGFLGFLSIIGVWGMMDSNVRHSLSFLLCIGYFSYFFVKPDELFRKRVLQSSTLTLIMTFIVQFGFYLLYLFTNNVEFFVHGFWISLTVMTVTFPLVFLIFEVKDGTL